MGARVHLLSSAEEGFVWEESSSSWVRWELQRRRSGEPAFHEAYELVMWLRDGRIMAPSSWYDVEREQLMQEPAKASESSAAVAKHTRVLGHTYDSKLEGRIALMFALLELPVFPHLLTVRWNSFPLPRPSFRYVTYTPDMYIPLWRMLVDVKANHGTVEEQLKMSTLARAGFRAAILRVEVQRSVYQARDSVDMAFVVVDEFFAGGRRDEAHSDAAGGDVLGGFEVDARGENEVGVRGEDGVGVRGVEGGGAAVGSDTSAAAGFGNSASLTLAWTLEQGVHLLPLPSLEALHQLQPHDYTSPLYRIHHAWAFAKALLA